MGGKRLPTDLKLAKGTYRADRQGNPEEEPKGIKLDAVPSAPKSLDVVGKKKWKEICEKMLKQGILEDRFLDSIEQACIAFQDCESMTKVIAKEGHFIESPRTGFKCQHPAVGIRNTARDMFRRWMLELGFSPKSSSAVRIQGAKGSGGIKRRERKSS